MIAKARRTPLALRLGVGVAALGAAAVLLLRPGTAAAPITAAAPSPSPSVTAAPTPTVSPTPTPLATPVPTPLPSLPPGIADLTGQHVADNLAHRLPIAVLIDDNRVARPQSGFNGASIVYQAPADGGETRYMLVFQEGESRDIGPVRSGRSYFIHWASEMRAAIAHYGGDKISRDYFKAHDGTFFTDIDALRTTGKPFHRIATRNAPHNAYTRTGALRAVIAALGGPAGMPVELGRRPFVDPSPVAGRGRSQTINVPYRTGQVRYVFDRSSDLYRRWLDGRVQIDPADGHRVTTRNVVVLFMSFHTDSTIEVGHARPVLGDIGVGRALIFREGRLVV
ncbi:MAG: DUF3048 domain-containing protein, partial [Chloroflexota bacterium]